MKKLDLLRGILVVVLGLWLIGLVGQFVYTLFYGGLTDYETFRFGSSTFVISIIFSLFLFIAIYVAYQAITEISRKGYYNSLSANKFKISGLLIIATQIMSIVFQLMNHSPRTLENTISFWIMDGLFLLIGLGLLSISDVLKEGKLLKDENELTI